MANNVGELIGEIFGLVGIDATDEKYKPLVSITTPIDADTADKISKNILSIDTAKMSSQLKAHFKAQTLNGVDAQHEELATEYGLDPADAAELKSIKDTFERNKKLIAKVKANVEKLNAGKGDTAKLVEENRKLNDAILASKADFDKKLADIQANKESELNDYAIMSHLRSLKYANENVDADINALTAKSVIQNALASKKIGVKRDATNTLRLYQLENPELDYLENHKPISFADLASKELQAKKMLAITDPSRATGKTGKDAAPAGGKNDAAPDNSEAISFYDQQLAQFER
jgi:hypothetical protein